MRTGKLSDANSMPDFRLANILRAIINVVDGNLSFGDNINAAVIRNVFFKNANFDYPIVHELGRTTNDFLIIGANTFGKFKRGTQQANQDQLWVQCDTSSTLADILVF